MDSITAMEYGKECQALILYKLILILTELYSPVRIPFLQTPLLRRAKRRLRHHHHHHQQQRIIREPLELCLHCHLPLGHRHHHHHHQRATMMELLHRLLPRSLYRRHHPDMNGGLHHLLPLHRQELCHLTGHIDLKQEEEVDDSEEEEEEEEEGGGEGA